MNIAFYSYKGGVGRTQLCANVAAYLCYFKKKKVLLWDWDFEAPGLHHYFGIKEEQLQCNGTLELLESHMRMMRSQRKVTHDELHRIGQSYIKQVYSDGLEGKIDLIPAGDYMDNYAMRISEFNWKNFLANYDGTVFINSIKEQIHDLDYDYVLIDSRTGISDYAGICNVLLPDVNVVLVAPNQQNFQGSKKIIDQILNHPYVQEGYRSNLILPILSRIDTDNDNAEKWTLKFMKIFSYLLPNLIQPSNKDQQETSSLANKYVEYTLLRYTYAISIGENIFFKPKKNRIDKIAPGSFRRNYANISNFLDQLKTYGKLQLDHTTLSEAVDNQVSTEQAEKLLKQAEFAQNENDTALAKQHYDKATQVCKQILQRDETAPKVWLTLGKIYLSQKMHKKAIRALTRAIEIDEQLAEAWMQLGNCLFEIEDYREAEKTMKKAIEVSISIDSDLVNIAKYYRGWILIEEGKKNIGLRILNNLQLELLKYNKINQRQLIKDIQDTESIS